MIVKIKRLKSNNLSEQEEKLIETISQLSPEEMIGFRLRTDQLLHDSYRSNWWCAGYILNGGCSDDGFEYFRNWVISRGKDAYYAAKENPDKLIDYLAEDQDEFEFESFWYVALEAFQRRTGKDLYDYVDDEKFKTSEGNYPEMTFDWNEEEPETMKAICPRLFSAFW